MMSEAEKRAIKVEVQAVMDEAFNVLWLQTEPFLRKSVVLDEVCQTPILQDMFRAIYKDGFAKGYRYCHEVKNET